MLWQGTGLLVSWLSLDFVLAIAGRVAELAAKIQAAFKWEDEWRACFFVIAELIIQQFSVNVFSFESESENLNVLSVVTGYESWRQAIKNLIQYTLNPSLWSCYLIYWRVTGKEKSAMYTYRQLRVPNLVMCHLGKR